MPVARSARGGSGSGDGTELLQLRKEENGKWPGGEARRARVKWETAESSGRHFYCTSLLLLPKRVDGQGKGTKQSHELSRGSPVMGDARSPAGSGPRTWRGAPLRPHPHPALTHCTRVPESGQIFLRRSAASQESLRGAVPAVARRLDRLSPGGKTKAPGWGKGRGHPASSRTSQSAAGFSRLFRERDTSPPRAAWLPLGLPVPRLPTPG